MILSIDPGEMTGAAVFAGKTPAVTSIKRPAPADADRLIAWCQATSEARGEALVVQVEDQFAQPKMVRIRGRLVPKVNFDSLRMLVRSAEIWVVVAGLRGVPVERTLASVWQPKMHKGAPKNLDTKGKSRHVFPGFWPEVYRFDGVPESDSLKRVKAARLNEHIRDAALMGRWLQLYGGYT